MKNPWSDRWVFVKNYIPDNTSIIDFGCGNKELLDYVNPTRYLGVDRLSCADLVADLDQNFVLHDKFDLALLLGVLEYVKDHLTVHEATWIKRNEWHQLCNETDRPLKLIEIQFGENCVEEDIERQ